MYDDWTFISCFAPECSAEKGVPWGFDDEFQTETIQAEGWQVLDLSQGDFRCPKHRQEVTSDD